jgi:single-stranded-DNA-specific exonuclease
VERAHGSGCKVLIANDCGTTAHDAIARAGELNLDVVVCDHHMPESTLPPAHALVNPRRADDAYPFPDLAAVGVAFKILQGLIQLHYGDAERRFLFNQLDLVTLGTIADVVPLVGENRIFVHFARGSTRPVAWECPKQHSSYCWRRISICPASSRHDSRRTIPSAEA